ncbi:DMT family transporter [Romboutsia sp.]|uniref:DMT family transporter n=1 Tax=Romboutsia sp. TaxID=1965302 RepID=UPI003F33BCC8
MSGVLKIIVAMCIWGSLGVFVKNISLESFEIAFLRAVIASVVVGAIVLIKNNKKEVDNEEQKYSKKSFSILILSGVLIGFNWVLLFQSYEYTTISNATLSYYFAPVIVVFLSPFILKEKFTLKVGVSVISAMLGLFLIVNSQSSAAIGNFNHAKGISIALGAACLYATVVMLNKYIQDIDDYERTFIQLFSAAIVLLPFIIYRNDLVIKDSKSLILILILGVVHTGVAYCLYFSAIKEIKAQTTALLSYTDPVSAIFFSVVFLSEPLSIMQIIGGSIILISAFIAERTSKEKIQMES